MSSEKIQNKNDKSHIHRNQSTSIRGANILINEKIEKVALKPQKSEERKFEKSNEDRLFPMNNSPKVFISLLDFNRNMKNEKLISQKSIFDASNLFEDSNIRDRFMNNEIKSELNLLNFETKSLKTPEELENDKVINYDFEFELRNNYNYNENEKGEIILFPVNQSPNLIQNLMKNTRNNEQLEEEKETRNNSIPTKCTDHEINRKNDNLKIMKKIDKFSKKETYKRLNAKTEKTLDYLQVGKKLDKFKNMKNSGRMNLSQIITSSGRKGLNPINLEKKLFSSICNTPNRSLNRSLNFSTKKLGFISFKTDKGSPNKKKKIFNIKTFSKTENLSFQLSTISNQNLSNDVFKTLDGLFGKNLENYNEDILISKLNNENNLLKSLVLCLYSQKNIINKTIKPENELQAKKKVNEIPKVRPKVENLKKSLEVPKKFQNNISNFKTTKKI